MPSIEYEYTNPFIEEQTNEYEDPESGEIVTQTREVERVPIRVYTRKWKEVDDGVYRLWLRITVTEFGQELYNSGVPSDVTVPDWYDAMSNEVNQWIESIQTGVLPDEIIESSVSNATATVEEVTDSGDDCNAIMKIEVNEFPVVAELGAATASFNPNGGEV